VNNTITKKECSVFMGNDTTGLKKMSIQYKPKNLRKLKFTRNIQNKLVVKEPLCNTLNTAVKITLK